MKILTEKEQLYRKMNKIDEAIRNLSIEVNKAGRRRMRKMEWGWASFITDEYWILDAVYKTKLSQLDLLIEYKELILLQIRKAK